MEKWDIEIVDFRVTARLCDGANAATETAMASATSVLNMVFILGVKYEKLVEMPEIELS